MTLGQLASFIDRAWSIYEVIGFNFDDRRYDIEEIQDFVVEVSSEFYPQFGRLYRDLIAAWATDRWPEPKDDDCDPLPHPRFRKQP